MWGIYLTASLKGRIKIIFSGKQSEILSIESNNQSMESLNSVVLAGLLLKNIVKGDNGKVNTPNFQLYII